MCTREEFTMSEKSTIPTTTTATESTKLMGKEERSSSTFIPSSSPSSQSRAIDVEGAMTTTTEKTAIDSIITSAATTRMTMTRNTNSSNMITTISGSLFPTSFSIHLKYEKNVSRVIANSNCILIEYRNCRSSPPILIPLSQVISIWPCSCGSTSTRKLTCECIDRLSKVPSEEDREDEEDDNERIEHDDDNRHCQSSQERCKENRNREEETVQMQIFPSSSLSSSLEDSSGSYFPPSSPGSVEGHEERIAQGQPRRQNQTRQTKMSNNNNSNRHEGQGDKDNQSDTAAVKVIRIFYAVPFGKFHWKVISLPLSVPSGKELAESIQHPPSPFLPDSASTLSSSSSSSSESTSPSPSPSVSAIQKQILSWVANVTSLIDAFNRPKKLLVFINPFGGKRKAPQIYHRKVEPLLRIARIEPTVILTQRANHARDSLQNLDNPTIKDFHGIICVGGDGMFAELLNGVIIRTQMEQSINFNNPESKLSRPFIPVGVIPAGSTDAVAFGVTGVNDPVTSTVHVIFGNTVNIDISAVHDSNDGETLIRYATSVLGYGFLGDVLLDSEKNRWMGPKRYDWAGFKKLLSLKAYEGEIKLHISTDAGSPKDPSDVCTTDCPLCERSFLKSKFSSSSPSSTSMTTVNTMIPSSVITTRIGGEQPLEERTKEEKRGEGRKTGNNCTSEDGNRNQKKNGFCVDEDSSILTIRGKFLSVNAATMSCRCEKSKKGLSPAAHLGNGCADLIIVSQCSRLDYIRFLMRTGYSLSSSPFDLPFVDVYRVKEFSYRPIPSGGGEDSTTITVENNNELDTRTTESSTTSNNNHQELHHVRQPPLSSENGNKSNKVPNGGEEGGVWNCDGEIIPSAAIRVKTHCQLLPVFGVGLENRLMNRITTSPSSTSATSLFLGGKKLSIRRNNKIQDISSAPSSPPLPSTPFHAMKTSHSFPLGIPLTDDDSLTEHNIIRSDLTSTVVPYDETKL